MSSTSYCRCTLLDLGIYSHTSHLTHPHTTHTHTHTHPHTPSHPLTEELRWECWLWGRVLPEQCKVVPGRVRTELRLRKVEPLIWPEYEMVRDNLNTNT